MISISTGDIMHVIGGFGLQMDYTVRMKLRLTDEVDGAILAEAVAKTQRRLTEPAALGRHPCRISARSFFASFRSLNMP